MTLNFLLSPLSPFISLFIIVCITFFLLLPKNASCTDDYYLACNPKSCGDGQLISFPFYIQDQQQPFCGYPGFNLSCNPTGSPLIKLLDADYLIHQIFYENQSLRVSSAAVFDDDDTCIKNPPIQNISLSDGRFDLSPNQTELFFLYNCSESVLGNSSELLKYRIGCFGGTENGSTLAMLEDDPLLGYAARNCMKGAAAPVDVYRGEDGVGLGEIKGMLERGFMLIWVASNCSICEESGGKCGFNSSMYHFRCFCPDRPHAWRCNSEGTKMGLKLGLGLGLGCTGILIILLSSYIFWNLYKRQICSNLQSINSTSDHSSKSDLEGGSIYFGVRIFSYKELEEATNNFDTEKELGDGGFGTVYYGKLRDGREVAVKRLYEHNYRRVEQFMNEIEILARLHHKNLVSLYGCTSRYSRGLMLVYEYIPNGTVADHLHGDQAKPGLLTWPVRMSIAIETARALAYLHASDIIHRDVKTNNILLDNNFCVKVADFGLSRLFPNAVTHVSTAPQGTPGYVDPEYHQCYHLTDKSDVYSFGVVLIELISSMPAVDITRHRDEINLANLALNKIKNCAFDELIDLGLGYETDEEVKRMTTSVAELAFRCLQQDKETRPSMDEVLQELETIESGEQKENQEQVHDDNKASKNIPPSPLNCDEDPLLKNIRLQPSPDSVTSNWGSSSSCTPSVSG